MKKLLLLFMAVFATAISMTAQTGSLVREDCIWTQGVHSYHHEKIFEHWNEGDSYRFEGSCEKNGKTYMILLNEGTEWIEGNQQIALMRQEGAKVYRYTDESVKTCIKEFETRIEQGWCSDESIALWNEHSRELDDEVLLYDFDAQPGDKYISFATPMLGEDAFGYDLSEVLEIEVLDCYTINVNGADYRCQVVRNNLDLRDQYIIVEGIGSDIGFLCSPMFEYPLTSGFSDSEPIMYSVSDTSGNTLFEYKDFVTDHVGLTWLRRWEYVFATQDGNQVNITLFYVTNGGLLPDCLKDNVIKWSYTLNEQTGELTYNNDKSVSSEYMDSFTNITDKEGRLYMAVSDEMREDLQYEGDGEIMLYDFNAKAGDYYKTFKISQELGGKPFNPTFEEVKVLETGYTEIENQNCRIHKILCDGREYSIIEGLGSVETGLIPYSNIYDPANGVYSGFRLNRVFNFLLNKAEEYVIYECPNYIDVNNLGNTDGVEAMFGEQLGLLHYDGNAVTAFGVKIYLYNMSGSIVKEGFGEVSTENLQPGVYVAKAGAQTLKILVK